jgi:PPOX class probable F420-dependent enzyme
MATPTFEPWHTALIDELRVARLATIGTAGAPHLVPVSYVLAQGAIWIPVDEKPKATTDLARLRNIERDRRVSLLFDRYDDDWTRLAWVRDDGSARVLEAGHESPGALAALRSRYAQYAGMALEERPLIAITPVRIAAWRWTAG